MDILGPCFYLILQVFYNEDLIHEEAILSWVASAREKIATPEPEKQETASGDEVGDYDSEQDSGAEPVISREAMQVFVTGMEKFEEYLQSQIGAADEEGEEYYDEEEGGEEY